MVDDTHLYCPRCGKVGGDDDPMIPPGAHVCSPIDDATKRAIHEKWLSKDPKAQAGVRVGIEDSKAGRIGPPLVFEKPSMKNELWELVDELTEQNRTASGMVERIMAGDIASRLIYILLNH